MIRIRVLVLLAAFSMASVACGNTPPASTGGDTSGGGGGAGGGAAGGTLDAQVTQGKALYADNCAMCHGANGEGKGAPALIGKAALPTDPPSNAKQRKSPFKTAVDVNSFSMKTMPPGNAGSLKEEEYFAITAYVLKTSGTDLGGKKLDGSTAASVNLR